MTTIDSDKSIFYQISNDIKKVVDDKDDDFRFLYEYVPCTLEDAMWGNNNGPQPQRIKSDNNTFNLPHLSRDCISCHSIWNNSTSRKLIVKDF